jgi:hypothetical protein
MDKNEATWIAISALQWVIATMKINPENPTDQEHLDEKKEALEILLASVY